MGPRHWSADVERASALVGVDSSEPDINEGQVGRERYIWIHERFEVPADLKVFVLPPPPACRSRAPAASGAP